MITKKIINKDGKIEYTPLIESEIIIFTAYRRACEKLPPKM